MQATLCWYRSKATLSFDRGSGVAYGKSSPLRCVRLPFYTCKWLGLVAIKRAAIYGDGYGNFGNWTIVVTYFEYRTGSGFSMFWISWWKECKFPQEKRFLVGIFIAKPAYLLGTLVEYWYRSNAMTILCYNDCSSLLLITHTHTHIHKCKYIHTYANKHTYIHTSMHTCMYVCMHKCFTCGLTENQEKGSTPYDRDNYKKKRIPCFSSIHIQFGLYNRSCMRLCSCLILSY